MQKLKFCRQEKNELAHTDKISLLMISKKNPIFANENAHFANRKNFLQKFLLISESV